MRLDSNGWIGILHAFITATVMCLSCAPAHADEVVFLCSISLKQWVESIRADFERDSGHKVKAEYLAVAPLKRRIEGGEKFDLALLLDDTIADLGRRGLVVAPRDEARTAMGVAVRAGAKPLDLSTSATVRAVLQEAKSMSYSRDSASGQYFVSLFDRLGIAEAKGRLVQVPSGAVEAVGRGEAELTIITIPNIVGKDNVALAGKLPAELQSYTVFTSGLAPSANKAATEFREYLAGRRNDLQRFGLEPPG